MDIALQQSTAPNEENIKVMISLMELEKYEELFKRRGLSFDTFVNITPEDLDIIGLTDEEDRTTFLNYIQPFQSTYKEIDCEVPIKVETIVGNSVHQLYVIAARMRQLRKRLETTSQTPPNTLIDASVPATTAIKHFIGVFKDQVGYIRADLIEALPYQSTPQHVYYFRRAMVLGVLGSIICTSVLLTRLIRSYR